MTKRTSGRVVLSKNTREALALSEKLYQRFVLDGAGSPLNLLDDFDWAATGPNIAIALQLHEDAENHKRKMEEAYRQRDLLLPDISDITRTSIGLLKKIYSKNPKKLGDYGIDIDDSKRKAVPTPNAKK